jgi:hypothetical protein
MRNGTVPSIIAGLAIGIIFIFSIHLMLKPSMIAEYRLTNEDKMLLDRVENKIPEVHLFLTKYPFASVELQPNEMTDYHENGTYNGTVRLVHLVYAGVKSVQFSNDDAKNRHLLTYHSLSLIVTVDANGNPLDMRSRCSMSYPDSVGSQGYEVYRESVLPFIKNNRCFTGQ